MSAPQERVASWRELLRMRGNRNNDFDHVATVWLSYRAEQGRLVFEVQGLIGNLNGAEVSTVEVAEALCAPIHEAEWALGVVEGFGVAASRLDDVSMPTRVMWREVRR